jgi:hypothetical protein
MSDNTGTPRFCNKCKPEWNVNCGISECDICSYTEVKGSDTDMATMYELPARSDCCFLCESWLEYKYQNGRFIYRDGNLANLHHVMIEVEKELDMEKFYLMMPYEGSGGLFKKYTPQNPRWIALATDKDRNEKGEFINDEYSHFSAIPPSDSRYDGPRLSRFFRELMSPESSDDE